MIGKSVLEKSHSNLRACVSRRGRKGAQNQQCLGSASEPAVWEVPTHAPLQSQDQRSGLSPEPNPLLGDAWSTGRWGASRDPRVLSYSQRWMEQNRKPRSSPDILHLWQRCKSNSMEEQFLQQMVLEQLDIHKQEIKFTFDPSLTSYKN